MRKGLRVDRVVEHSQEWHAYRTGGIGGSDMGTLMGLNKWKSSIQLFHEKVGTYKPLNIQNEAMFHGTHLEDYVANLWRYWDGEREGYLKHYGREEKIRDCRRVNGYIVNEKYPWLFASVDRLMRKNSHSLITGETLGFEAVLECKTISSWTLKQWEDGIPPAYIAQITQYMIVLEIIYGEFAILKDGRNFEVFPVEYSKDFGEALIDQSHDFWYNRIVPAKEYYLQQQHLELNGDINGAQEMEAMIVELEPLPDGSEAYRNFLAEKEMVEPEEVKGEKKHYEKAKEIKMLQAMKKKLEELETKRKSELMRDMLEFGADNLTFEGKERLDLKPRKGSSKLVFNNRIKGPDVEEVEEAIKELQFNY